MLEILNTREMKCMQAFKDVAKPLQKAILINPWLTISMLD